MEYWESASFIASPRFVVTAIHARTAGCSILYAVVVPQNFSSSVSMVLDYLCCSEMLPTRTDVSTRSICIREEQAWALGLNVPGTNRQHCPLHCWIDGDLTLRLYRSRGLECNYSMNSNNKVKDCLHIAQLRRMHRDSSVWLGSVVGLNTTCPVTCKEVNNVKRSGDICHLERPLWFFERTRVALTETLVNIVDYYDTRRTLLK